MERIPFSCYNCNISATKTAPSTNSRLNFDKSAQELCIFPAFLPCPQKIFRFSFRKRHRHAHPKASLKIPAKKAKNQLTNPVSHAKISKSSGFRMHDKQLNMGVFPSGQWGQTVNLLLSASVVRIHPRPPNKKNPNLFPIGEGFGFFVFFGYDNDGSRGRRKTPIPCHRP